MTASELTQLAWRASRGVDHAPGAMLVVLAAIGSMDLRDRINAAKCYLAVIGEPFVPAHVGRTHLEARLPGRRKAREASVRATKRKAHERRAARV